MSNSSPRPSVSFSQSGAAAPSASAASPQGGALSVHDLSTDDSDVEWDDSTLAIATHFGYAGDGVPRQWLCATARDA